VQPLLQWKRNYFIFWVCICSLRYPAHNAHAPYCHLWPASLYNIFPHYLKFHENTQVPNFMKIRPVWAELFHVGRRRDGRSLKLYMIPAIVREVYHWHLTSKARVRSQVNPCRTLGRQTEVGQASFPVLPSFPSPVSFIPPMLHTHSYTSPKLYNLSNWQRRSTTHFTHHNTATRQAHESHLFTFF